MCSSTGRAPSSCLARSAGKQGKGYILWYDHGKSDKMLCSFRAVYRLNSHNRNFSVLVISYFLENLTLSRRGLVGTFNLGVLPVVLLSGSRRGA